MAVTEDGSLTGWGGTNTWPPLRHVTDIDAGYTHCLAILGDGKPAILQQPFSRRLTEGEAAFLHVRASGILPLTYQWQKDGVNIPRATNSSLAIHVSAEPPTRFFKVETQPTPE